MTKQEFLTVLSEKLHGLPKEDREEQIAFYSEMIDDRIEEGATEDEAISQIGTVEEVITQILSEIPMSKILKAKTKSKRAFKTWELLLLIVGSPLWGSLLLASIAVILSVYLSVWSIVISLWSVFAALVALVPTGILWGILGSGGIRAIGFAMGILCFGLAIYAFFGCLVLTKYMLALTKQMWLLSKKALIGKEKAQ